MLLKELKIQWQEFSRKSASTYKREVNKMQIRSNQYQNRPTFGMALRIDPTVESLGHQGVKAIQKPFLN